MGKSIIKNTYYNTVKWINKFANFQPLLKSRIILYLFFIISLGNLYNFAVNGDQIYAAIFILVGYLTSFFSQNMIVIMVCALAISNILKYGVDGRSQMDGFTTADDTAPADPKTNVNDVNAKDTANDTTVSKPDTANDTAISKPDMAISKPDTAATTSLSKTDTASASETKDKLKKSLSDVEKAPNMDNETKKDYKKMLDLQLKLLSGVSELQPVLKEAQMAMEKLKEKGFA